MSSTPHLDRVRPDAGEPCPDGTHEWLGIVPIKRTNPVVWVCEVPGCPGERYTPPE